MSVLLLFLFHFASLDPSLQWKRLAWSPNTWEFCVYVAYLQQMASYSQLTMTKSPYFLWDFTDGFSWTNFLMHQSIPSLRARRLKTVIILDGLVGYADRIGINESAILLHVISGFAVVVAFFATIFCTSAMYARIKSRATRDSHVDEYGVWNIPYRVLGLLVLVWFFALYPLCVMASFEIYMEIHASLVAPGSLVAAIIALVVVCAFMLAYTMRTLLSKTETELRQYKMIAIWGVFYLDCWFITRLFFVFGVFFQIISAICIGVLDSNAFLLSILIGIQVLNLIAVLVVKPFADRLVRNITLSVQVLKIINFSLGFAFLQGQSLPSSERLAIANAFIGINTLVIIAWFVRLLVVFAHALSAFLMRERVGNGSYSPRESPDSGGLEMYKFAATSTPEIPTGRFTGLQSLSLSSAQESATWSYYLRDCSSPRPLPGAVLSPSI
ncbi:hypothetical protein Poli38472_003845 [Pythium oligandrum]|uniref:TRP C-terminal domain-containing protein n=1 Tax=Pythium oligandrum TaxID=41045 RepID=A0A8K1CNY1_PYTOL|nr:hypothetical protein Poli38472_003845 [Pythium oligandrum]|eukprot:TMW66080.1 hypothetical protein Poli38472_003845 [Pythium oligandrum]